MLTLAHEGLARYRDRFELVYRREAEGPNAVWRPITPQLDLLILDERRRPALSDDGSRRSRNREDRM